MTWLVFGRLDPRSRPWVALELPLKEMAEESRGDEFVEAILSRHEALADPIYREAVLEWDANDASAMEQDMYLHAGLSKEDIARDRQASLDEINNTDWDAWKESLNELDRDRDLIEAYWLHHRGSTLDPNEDANFWAWEAVQARLQQDAEATWVLILDLVRTAPNEDALSYMAAGILEDFIKERGSAFIERMETEARRSPRFIKALGGVWLNDDDDPDVVARVAKLLPEESSPAES